MPHKVRLHPAAERLAMESGLLRDEVAHLLAELEACLAALNAEQVEMEQGLVSLLPDRL